MILPHGRDPDGGPLSRRPHDALPPPDEEHRLPELLLYFGNACNRDCFFCCIEGSPSGWHLPFEPDAAPRIAALVRPDGRIKLYGGEPTLGYKHVIRLLRALRTAGYLGRLTVFSNGIQAHRLIEILESDPPSSDHPGSDCYLNPHIWDGLGVEPIPPGRRAALETWATENPGRLWLSHDDLLPVGSGRRGLPRALPVVPTAPFGGSCARCWPTVRSDGRIHACAFAAEEASPRYTLGHLGTSTAESIEEARLEFLRWIDEEVTPAARAEGALPCEVCIRSARAVTKPSTTPAFGPP